MPVGHYFLTGFAWNHFLTGFGNFLPMPVGHLFNFAGNTPAEIFERGQTGLEKKWASLLKKAKFLSMPVGHHFLTGFAWHLFKNSFLCQALPGFAWL